MIDIIFVSFDHKGRSWFDRMYGYELIEENTFLLYKHKMLSFFLLLP